MNYNTILDLKELFHDIQLSGVFLDSKTFPDLVPKKSLIDIVNNYNALRGNEFFSIYNFLDQNFHQIVSTESNFQTQSDFSEVEHINSLWRVLEKSTKDELQSTLVPLPKSFIVPGGRFRELYYWDSYFTMLGLIISGEKKLVENMVDNFAYLIDKYGFIPNGNRTYFLSRSQPPFFSLMVELLNKFDSEKKPEHYLKQLKAEYEFWMEGIEEIEAEGAIKRIVKLKDGTVLNRYWDNETSPRPESYKEDFELAESINGNKEELIRNVRAACESGWDFSSRWMANKENLESIITTDILPVDLNCLLYNLELKISEFDTTNKELYLLKAQNRLLAIDKYFWKDNFYFDYNYKTETITGKLTLAGVYPLFFKIADENKAQKVENVLKSKFLKTHGLITTLTNSGQQWDAPNGWAPLQWIAYVGLKNYQHIELANEIKKRWLSKNEAVFTLEKKFTEKYNVVDDNLRTGGGEYPNQDGFGWTNGVYLALKNAD